MRVNPAPSSSTALTDLPKAGLSLHLEADAGIEQAASGAVQIWMDQSSFGNALTAHGQPLVIIDNLSGNLVLTVDGVDDAITGELSINGDGHSLYIVARYLGSGDGNLLSLRSRASSGIAGIEVSADGSFQSRRAGDTLQQTFVDTTTGFVVLNTHSNESLSTDDAPIVFDLGAIGDTGTSTSVAMQVGALLLYDRQLTEVEHDAVMSYLLEKYGD